MLRKNNLTRIRAIFMDVDGVLTDGKITLGNNLECKSYHVRDGMAIALARACNLKIGFITNRTSESVRMRAEELKIDFLFQGTPNKLLSLKEVCQKEKFSFREICYIGDDIPDIPALKQAGFSATVSDAPEEVKACVQYVSEKSGGDEAVRDIIRHILIAQGKWTAAIDTMVSELEKAQ